MPYLERPPIGLSAERLWEIDDSLWDLPCGERDRASRGLVCDLLSHQWLQKGGLLRVDINICSYLSLLLEALPIPDFWCLFVLEEAA